MKIMQLIKQRSLILFIKMTQNNILCTITDFNGNSLKSSSVGAFKSKGTKKITTTSIRSLVKNLYNFIFINYKFTSLYLRIKGINKNKNELIKSFKSVGFNIIFIQESFILSFGGCRNKKQRKL